MEVSERGDSDVQERYGREQGLISVQRAIRVAFVQDLFHLGWPPPLKTSPGEGMDGKQGSVEQESGRAEPACSRDGNASPSILVHRSIG
jgi:hypothetical protein